MSRMISEIEPKRGSVGFRSRDSSTLATTLKVAFRLLICSFLLLLDGEKSPFVILIA